MFQYNCLNYYNFYFITFTVKTNNADALISQYNGNKENDLPCNSKYTCIGKNS